MGNYPIWHESSVTQLSPLLSNVRSLTIRRSTFPPTRDEGDGDPPQWLEFLRPLSGVRVVDVAERFVPGIAQALGMVTEDMATEVLPALRLLTLHGYRKFASVQEAAERFVATSQCSGHHIGLYG